MPPAKKRARRHRRPWSDLPHDLLSVILDRLTPAYGDRVRFRSVCQAWRAAELAHPHPPTMPWLVAPGRCVSLQEASIHRVPLPADAAAAVCLGSFGHWLALLPPTGRPFLLNAFTMERIKLPRRTKQPMVKFVMSSAPDSKSCKVAAIVANNYNSDFYMRSKIVVCHVGRGGSWRTITSEFELHDIIFFEGKLHALHAKARIHVFRDGDLQRDEPWRPNLYDPLDGRLYLDDAKLHLVVLHGRLLMVGRAFGKTRVPGWAHFTSNVGVFEIGKKKTAKLPEPVKDLEGHAVFVGDSCCEAFPVPTGGGKIRENQIFFVDDEKNYLSSLAALGRGLFRLLQSYDVRNGCLRTYRPPDESSSGTWRCVTALRFPQRYAMGLPPLEAVSEEELRLRDMLNCLGAIFRPVYITHKKEEQDAEGSIIVTVHISVPKTAALLKEPASWSFTQSRPSTRKATRAAAHEAATFLRSRFRSILDDSPWSSVPHYHSHVEDEEEVEEKEEAHGDYHCLFGHRHWYGYRG